MSEVEKTCENCKYDYEDIEGAHCRRCIHNAEEHFEPKTDNILDEFITAYKEYCEEHYGGVAEQEIDDMKLVAEQMKGGAE